MVSFEVVAVAAAVVADVAERQGQHTSVVLGLMQIAELGLV